MADETNPGKEASPTGLILFSSPVTSEAPKQVSYATSCLGSESVTLHEATSSADDVRAVFVYKGGEILGSDIIPAEGEYKGRLRISRQGEVTLYDVRLADSGVFKVEMAKIDSKTSASVVLFLPEPPRIEDSGLHVHTMTSPGEQRVERLSCGRFHSLGFPSASVLWKDPEGRLLTSTGYDDGYFHLHLTDTSPAGNYTCMLHCSSPNTCCLPPHTPSLPSPSSSLPHHSSLPLPHHVSSINIDPCPSCTPPNRRLPPLPPSGPSEEETPPDDVTSALRKTGREMAAGMAALVNDQVQDTLQTSQQHLQEWKESLEQSVKKQIQDLRQEFNIILQEKLGHMAGNSPDVPESSELTSSGVPAKEKSFKTPASVNLLPTELQSGRLEKIEESLETIHQEIDEEKQEFREVLKPLTKKVTGLQKKFKSMRQSMKKHNVLKHDAMIRTLNDETKARFQEIYQKISDWESEHQLTDEEIVASVQQGVSQVTEQIFQESCSQAQQQGNRTSGPYTLRPPGLSAQSFWCDMDSGDGGWMVIQRRQNSSDLTEGFYRPWQDYVAGFGDHSSSNRDFWLGLGKLYTLTRERPHSLRVDLRTVDGVRGHAVYRRVRVLSARRKYRLSVQGYYGTAGDSLAVHNKPFSTWDQDNDDWSEGNCAKNYKSAWWYAGCRISDLNAPNVRGPDGVMWLYGDDTWGAGKIAFSEMKIRPLV
ncbi:hypothetical protein ACOMHN_008319 [Nucella lapillus]